MNGGEEFSNDGSKLGEKKRRLNMEQLKTLEKNFEREGLVPRPNSSRETTMSSSVRSRVSNMRTTLFKLKIKSLRLRPA
ncbi:hypothetical protein Bca52824_072573 [Brassica carinata]|uniref:Uncharacterized protein n=1 Tax=Brassica carinata TaxID=52824 RepID=A0A8X7QDQ2_BRACI|nr:hypothetical protein Bca52824_072573 [Brassica carinata]